MPWAESLAALPTPSVDPMWDKLAFTFVCIALPVVWGVIVNRLFDLWRGQPDTRDDERIFPDYQI